MKMILFSERIERYNRAGLYGKREEGMKIYGFWQELERIQEKVARLIDTRS